MASSQPATSANVVCGVSFVISLARDLANFMKPPPPPWKRDMKNRKMPTSSRIGRIELAR